MASQGGKANELATDGEVEAAIQALTSADLLRLERIASFRARALAATGLGYDGPDLLQEAITRTVAGDRNWRKTVSFVTHLAAVMRSTSSHALESLQGAIVTSTSTEEARQIPAAPQQSNPERIAAARERYGQIRQRFDDDAEVALVLDGITADMKGIDIQRDLGLTPQQYETIMLRLRRGIDRSEGWAP